MSLLDAAKSIQIRPTNGGMQFTVPSWLLLVLVTGGILTNSLNIYVLHQSYETLRAQVDQHVARPAHTESADLLREMYDAMKSERRSG